MQIIASIVLLVSLLLVSTTISYKFGSSVAGSVVASYKQKDYASMVVNMIILISLLGISLSLMALIGDYLLLVINKGDV